MATKGYAAPEVQQTYTRARELGRQVGETPQLFPFCGDCGSFMLGGRSTRRRTSWRSSASRWPRAAKTPCSWWRPHYALGATLLQLGEFATARGHFEEMIALTTPSSTPLMPLCMSMTLGWFLDILWP